jgi:hypothetical protein
VASLSFAQSLLVTKFATPTPQVFIFVSQRRQTQIRRTYILFLLKIEADEYLFSLQIRLLCLRVIDDLFLHFSAFRRIFIQSDSYRNLFLAIFGRESHNITPHNITPLISFALEVIERWYEEYGHIYPQV